MLFTKAKQKIARNVHKSTNMLINQINVHKYEVHDSGQKIGIVDLMEKMCLLKIPTFSNSLYKNYSCRLGHEFVGLLPLGVSILLNCIFVSHYRKNINPLGDQSD